MSEPSIASNYLLIEKIEGLNIIRLNRPEKKNALTGAMYEAMSDGLIAGDNDPELGCHLILGCSGVFSAGNDIHDFVNKGMKEGGIGREVLRFLRTLVTTKKPIVAGVDGLAIGIGTTMLMHCDLVIASDQSFFQTPFVDLGLVPEAGSSLIAPRLMGYQKAFSLLALGERFNAVDAERAGLLNQVVIASELEPLAISLAQKLAAKPASALATTRALVKGNTDELLAQIDIEAEHFARHLATSDAQNAFARFINKA